MSDDKTNENIEINGDLISDIPVKRKAGRPAADPDNPKVWKRATTEEELAERKARSRSGLIPAKKGEVRNPYGRWGKGGIENSFRGMLTKILFDKGTDGSTKAELLMEVLLAKAMEGDTKAIDMVMDRYEGKVKDTVKVESDDGLACMILPAKRDKEIEGE